MWFALFLAQIEPFAPSVSTAGRGWGQQLSDVGLVVAAGFGVGLILLVCVRFFRRPRRSTHSHATSSAGRRERKERVAAAAAEEEDSGEGGGGGGRRRRRRRSPRREHRPRNPTLAETGGLPPARAGDDSQG